MGLTVGIPRIRNVPNCATQLALWRSGRWRHGNKDALRTHLPGIDGCCHQRLQWQQAHVCRRSFPSHQHCAPVTRNPRVKIDRLTDWCNLTETTLNLASPKRSHGPHTKVLTYELGHATCKSSIAKNTKRTKSIQFLQFILSIDPMNLHQMIYVQYITVVTSS